MTTNAPRFDYQSLYLALDRRRAELGLSWQQVAREIGGRAPARHRISPSTIVRTRRGGPMEADGVLAMIRWLGLSFQNFRIGTTWAPSERPLIGGQLRRLDSKAFYEAVNDKRMVNGMTWKEVASNIPGFSPGILVRLERRSRMSADQVVALAGWLGRAPEDFTYAARS